MEFVFFGQKHMSQMARVFSKLASPREAWVVSLGRQNIRKVPFNKLSHSSCAKVEFLILGRHALHLDPRMRSMPNYFLNLNITTCFLNFVIYDLLMFMNCYDFESQIPEF